MTSFVVPTYSLVDGAGTTWTVRSDGSANNGFGGVFDNAFDWNSLSFTPVFTLSDDGQTLTTTPTRSGDLIFQREIYVSPTDGFVRFLDTITNISGADRSLSYVLSNDFGADGGTALSTSSGDVTLDGNDQWFIGQDAVAGSTIPFGGVLFGDSGVNPTSFFQNFDDANIGYDLSIQSGQTLSVMHFGAIGQSAQDVLTMFDLLDDLGPDALAGLSAAQIETIVNWDVPDRALIIDGTNNNDTISGTGADDVLSGGRGRDMLRGLAGDDDVRGGAGADTVFGGLGDDHVAGDGTVSDVTTTNQTVLSDGTDLAISLTAPDASSSGAVVVSGFVSREPVVSEDVDIVFVIDVSGSTSSGFVGQVDVADLNGDGVANTILDAEIAAFESLLNSVVTDAQLGDANVAVVAFDTGASIVSQGRASEDQNGNGLFDLIEDVRTLDDGGGTSFDIALQSALSYFTGSDAGQKVLYFLSDGEHNGGEYSDEVQALLGLDVQIQSFGVGANADPQDLDLLDDGIDNNSETIVLDPSLLSDELLDPGIAAADVDRVDILLNGQVVQRIDGSDLTVTPFGLRYFEEQITGLNIGQNDVVEVRVQATDGQQTVLSTSQVIEDNVPKDGNDLLYGGGGRDTLEGGDGSDTLNGGRGADSIDGGRGRDFADYRGSDIGAVVDLANDSNNRGAAAGDRFESIEGVFGTEFDDTLLGGGKANVIRGQGGDDVISGRAGNDNLAGGGGDDQLGGGAGRDVLNGGAGDDRLQGGTGRDLLRGGAGEDRLIGGKGADTLSGGAGADQFVFTPGDGRDRITDFDRTEAGEVINLSGFNLGGMSALNAIAETVNGNTVITFASGDVLQINNVTEGQLSSGDFVF